MGNRTIDQILAECRGEAPIYGMNKEASAQPSVSSKVPTSEEIEKMAEFLSEAELPEAPVVTSESFEEKVAQALILSQTLAEVASANAEREKLASFKDAALKAGYDPSKVDEFIEKQAGMNMWGALTKAVKSPVAKGLAAATLLTGATAGGYEYGEHKTTEKAQKAIKTVGQQAYNTGLKTGFGVGLRRGAYLGSSATSQAWKEKLQRMHEKASQKGS